MYIYAYMYVYICICINICIYIHTYVICMYMYRGILCHAVIIAQCAAYGTDLRVCMMYVCI